MFSLKHVVTLVIFLQLFSLLTTCEAKDFAKQKQTYLRRLLQDQILTEGEVQDIAQAEGLDLGEVDDAAVSNSTSPIYDWESIEHLAGGEDVSEEGTGRRSLVATCSGTLLRDITRAFTYNAVRVNGQCLKGLYSGESVVRVPRGAVRLELSITDKDDYCPGCIEQVHFGMLGGKHECVNLGGGNFGTVNLAHNFPLTNPGYYWVYSFMDWQYHCLPYEKKESFIYSHFEGLIFGLVIVA